MIRIFPDIRTGARVGLVLAILLMPACAGQELARREGISFRYSQLASFREISPEDSLYRQAIEDALRVTEIRAGEAGALPRVLKGNSLWIDPPFLGRTAYLEGSIFVWEGTEVPLREVLTHEMIHWVLFHGGKMDLARNEAYVERLTAAVVEQASDEFVAGPFSDRGMDLADGARWHDAGVRQRNAERRRRGSFNRDEPGAQAIAHEHSRTWVPWDE